MRTPAVRSRLLRLRDDLRAAIDGRDLLDRKREAILRSLMSAIARRNRANVELSERLRTARTCLASAQYHLGRAAIDAAALAQPPPAPADITQSSLVGVRIPHVQTALKPFRPEYAPSSGSPELDDAGAAWTVALQSLLAFAAADAAVRRLNAALARTARRLNALDRELIPSLRDELRFLSAALEEEERDDAVRLKRWLTNAV